MNNKCACEWFGLEEGDTLFYESSWDGGIQYEYIYPIHYCPICGKKAEGIGE